jgi:hypothetical protein
MSGRTVTVHRVTSTAPGAVGLPAVGDALGYRRRPGAGGTCSHRVDTVNGAPASGLLIGFPVSGDLHARRTAELHTRLATTARPVPAGLAGAVLWHGTVRHVDGTLVHAAVGPDPYASGHLSLHDVLRDGVLDGGPLRARFELAYGLACAVDDLAAVGAVHGGLDSGTLLVRPADRAVRILEVESAAFNVARGHIPLAAGPAAGYLAPELYDDLGEHPESATPSTDRWSLAVALHEVLTGHHPYHFLSDLGPDVVGRYLAGRTWPAHDLDGTAAFATRYAAAFSALPAEVRAAFGRAFSDGWRDPQARPSAADWTSALVRWIGDPVIDELSVDRPFVVLGDSVTLTWRTRFADQVVIDGRPPGPPNGQLTLPLDRPRSFVLRAVGPCGTVEAQTARIDVVRVPQLRLADIRVPVGLHRGAGRPGDGVVRRPDPGFALRPPAIGVPARPRPPDPAVVRVTADAPSSRAGWAPHALHHIAESFWRLRVQKRPSSTKERFTP